MVIIIAANPTKVIIADVTRLYHTILQLIPGDIILTKLALSYDYLVFALISYLMWQFTFNACKVITVITEYHKIDSVIRKKHLVAPAFQLVM